MLDYRTWQSKHILAPPEPGSFKKDRLNSVIAQNRIQEDQSIVKKNPYLNPDVE